MGKTKINWKSLIVLHILHYCRYQLAWPSIIATSRPLHTLAYPCFQGRMVVDSSIYIYQCYLCLS
jgi:hypothetical protein